MRKIRLYGDMGKRFGRVFSLDVGSPAEAIRALSQLKPGFREYLSERLDKPFHVIVGDEPRDEAGLHGPVGRSEVIKIVPVTAGAKDVWGQIILGAALIALTIATGGTAAIWGAGMFTATAGNWLASMVIGVGMAMVLGGVSQLLAGAQKANTGLDNNANDTTWTFGSPTLTTGQGGNVPLGYGLNRIGGHVISAGIDAHTWIPGGFDPAVCLLNDGTRYGNGDTTPWLWARDES